MANQKGNQQQTNTGGSEQVLNEREVVLNIGSEAGVEPEMKFEILTTEPAEIIDPDTGEALGTLDLAKTRVEVVDVQDRLCVARTYETYRVNVGGVGWDFRAATISGLLGPPRWETRVTKLRFDEEDRLPELSSEERVVRIGDKVRQVLER
jgi:hypothetical protein